MLNREKLISQHEGFALWWQLPEQEELRKSCAAGWAFKVWQASRAAIEINLPGELREPYLSSNMVMGADAVKERLTDAGINYME